MSEDVDLATILAELAAMRPRQRNAILAALSTTEREIVARLLKSDHEIATDSAHDEWQAAFSPWLLARIAPDEVSTNRSHLTGAASESLHALAAEFASAWGQAGSDHARSSKSSSLLESLIAMVIRGRSRA